MKVKIFALVAAFFMLMGGSAWAQADVKGDVNKDGVVNEQDIAAILAIMAKNNGVAEKTKYYWYVGQEAVTPDNYTTICNVVNSLDDLPKPHITTGNYMPTYIFGPSTKTIRVTNNADKTMATSNVEINIDGYQCRKITATTAGAKVYFE
jgi:hypothetical protein